MSIYILHDKFQFVEQFTKLESGREYARMKQLMIFVFSLIFAWCLGGCSNGDASIGIIGGADGPTAIFVTSGINWSSVYGSIGVIVAAILVALMIYNKKKN